MKYDYLIVGAGLYGAVFAQMMTDNGRSCIVIDRRSHIGGNAHCEEVDGIVVHRYGPHIFHTSDQGLWEYVNRFSEFSGYVHAPVANYRGVMFNLPFNMNTFSRMWGISTPEEARRIITEQVASTTIGEPRNLEEQALKMVGRDVYETLVKGYTEKQWGRPCAELPAFIIKRLPLRFTYDNRYFSDRYQGIPVGGYDAMIGKMLAGSDVILNVSYRSFIKAKPDIAHKIVFTGMIDEFFDFRYGALDYRSVRFETETLNLPNWQGCAVVNYTDAEIPYTRIIEHKHFAPSESQKTIITREYSSEWKSGAEPFYPVNNEKNQRLYEKYMELARQRPDVIFGGRLGKYQYYDMDKVIRDAMDTAALEILSE